jgi:hypothetical protein
VTPPPIISTTGTIAAVHGTSPGPASGITYDVDVNEPGVGVMRLEGVAPHHQRWPDHIDTVAASVGDLVAVAIVGKSVQFHIVETADTTECG